MANFGKVHVGIDWDDKGIVSFRQGEFDPLNLIPNAPFIYSSLKYHTGGVIVVEPKLPPDTPFDSITWGVHGMNDVGAEAVTLRFDDMTAGGTYSGGVGDDGYHIPINPSTEYTLWTWFTSNVDYVNDGDHLLQVGALEYDTPGTTLVQDTYQQFDVDGGYLLFPVRVHFTSDASAAHLVIHVSKIDTAPHTAIDLTLLGVMLLEGDVVNEPVYNAGTANGFLDDITAYVTSMTGKIGKTNWESVLFDEGTLTLELDNQDRRFSPEYVDSPYYGFLKPYKRVWVTMEDEDERKNLIWSGWTHQFNIQTGNTNSRRATISCRQGLYNIEAQDPDLLVVSADFTTPEAIKFTMSQGYEIPTGTTDTTQTAVTVIQYADEGAVIPLFSPDFPANKDRSYITALQNISELNGNYLWLSRFGRIIFKNYDLVRTSDGEAVDYGLLLGANYVYSPLDLYKKIFINYDKWTFNDTDTGAIEMQGQEQNIASGMTNFPFTIHPTYNGKPLIGTTYLDVTSFLPVNYNSVPTTGTANAAFTEVFDGIYKYFTALSNNTTDLDYRLSLITRNSIDVWYATDVNQQITLDGSESKALNSLTYNNPLVVNDEMAADFLSLQVERRTNIRSWFDEFQIANKSLDAVSFMVNHTLGDVVVLQEEQTGNTPKSMIIIGESFSWLPTYMIYTYNLAPTGHACDICDTVIGDTTYEGSSDESLQARFTRSGVFTSECTFTEARIDWGDGNVFTTNSFSIDETHVYDTPGTYTITFKGLSLECGLETLDSGNVTVS